jgi:hypothetical protein
MVCVNILVEGPTDEFVARRVLEHAGLAVGNVYGRNGKADLLRRLPNYNQAARFAPWLVVVDLENCPILRPVCGCAWRCGRWSPG